MALQWPGPDVSNAPKFLISCGILLGIMVILYAARMYCRIWPKKNLWWDDYIISLAVAFSVADYALRVNTVQYGLGRHNYFVPPEDQIKGMEFIFIIICVWYVSVACMRISVAFLLLRFRDSQQPAWALVLRILIAVQILTTIASLVIQLTLCRPMRAFWEPIDGAYCVPKLFMEIWGYFHNSLGILCDLILSTMPLAFIIKMHIPLRRRIFVAVLMAMGFFTAITATIKTVYIVRAGKSGDTLWNMSFLNLLSKLEELVGIIAACIPCMASRIETFLQRFGNVVWPWAVVATLNTIVLKTRGSSMDGATHSKRTPDTKCGAIADV